MNYVLGSRIAAAVLVATIAATACGSEPTEVVVGVSDTANGTSTSDPMTDDSSLEQVSSTTATTSIETTTTATPTTEMPDTTTATTQTSEVPSTTASPALIADETIEPLGPAMVGIGEWAVIRGPRGDDEECHAGTLAFTLDGEIVHRYDELGAVYGTRLFNGLRGQDAFVINCEESIERILLQGSAILPDHGWPSLTDIRLYGDSAPDVRLSFDASFAWRGAVFTAYGTIGSPGRDELLVFDADTGVVEPIADRIGSRTDVDPVNRADMVVPLGWTAESNDGFLSVFSNASFSRIQLQRLDNAVEEPPAEGDDFLSSDSALVRLWSYPSPDGHSQVVDLVTATDWTYLSADGVRVVRRIPVGGSMVEVELFADQNDSSIDQDLPWLLLDLLRVIDGPVSDS